MSSKHPDAENSPESLLTELESILYEPLYSNYEEYAYEGAKRLVNGKPAESFKLKRMLLGTYSSLGEGKGLKCTCHPREFLDRNQLQRAPTGNAMYLLLGDTPANLLRQAVESDMRDVQLHNAEIRQKRVENPGISSSHISMRMR